jgi:hypothetical protein
MLPVRVFQEIAMTSPRSYRSALALVTSLAVNLTLGAPVAHAVNASYVPIAHRIETYVQMHEANWPAAPHVQAPQSADPDPFASLHTE